MCRADFRVLLKPPTTVSSRINYILCWNQINTANISIICSKYNNICYFISGWILNQFLLRVVCPHLLRLLHCVFRDIVYHPQWSTGFWSIIIYQNIASCWNTKATQCKTYAKCLPQRLIKLKQITSVYQYWHIIKQSRRFYRYCKWCIRPTQHLLYF